jgi:hypothetical protein
VEVEKSVKNKTDESFHNWNAESVPFIKFTNSDSVSISSSSQKRKSDKKPKEKEYSSLSSAVDYYYVKSLNKSSGKIDSEDIAQEKQLSTSNNSTGTNGIF